MTSDLDTTKSRLFELRFERLRNDAAAEARLELYRRALQPDGDWRRLEIPVPVGLWRVLVGDRLPAIVSLYGWENLTRREATLGRWLRQEGGPSAGRDAHGAVVESLESWILVESSAGIGLSSQRDRAVGGIDELRMQKVLNGSTRDAASVLAEVDLAAAISHGAQIDGLFELAVGPDRPLLVSQLHWPDGIDPHQAWARIDASDEIVGHRDLERSQYRRRLFAETSRYLLESFPIPA